MKFRRVLIFIFLALCSTVRAGSIFVEIEGGTVKRFEAKGATYAEIFKVAAAFAGVKDELVASPPEGMTLSLKDTHWAEIMLALYDSDLFVVEKRDGNKLIVSRRPRAKD